MHCSCRTALWRFHAERLRPDILGIPAGNQGIPVFQVFNSRYSCWPPLYLSGVLHRISGYTSILYSIHFTALSSAKINVQAFHISSQIQGCGSIIYNTEFLHFLEFVTELLSIILLNIV
jgi:hypothetical protein